MPDPWASAWACSCFAESSEEGEQRGPRLDPRPRAAGSPSRAPTGPCASPTWAGTGDRGPGRSTTLPDRRSRRRTVLLRPLATRSGPTTRRTQLSRRAPTASDFISAVQRDNVLGVQFHPEKSHRHGHGPARRFRRTPDARTPASSRACSSTGEALVKTTRFADPGLRRAIPSTCSASSTTFEVDEIVLLDISGAARPDSGVRRAAGRISPRSASSRWPTAAGSTTVDEMRPNPHDRVTRRSWSTPCCSRILRSSGGRGPLRQPGRRGVHRRPRHGRRGVRSSCGAARGRHGSRSGRPGPSGPRQLGVGEILLTSVDREGTMSGFDLDLVAAS